MRNREKQPDRSGLDDPAAAAFLMSLLNTRLLLGLLQRWEVEACLRKEDHDYCSVFELELYRQA